MIQIGAYNRLTVARWTDHGMYLTDGTEDVLLPRKYAPEGLEPGEMLRVFVLTDSEDRPIATTRRPKGVVGEFAALTAVAVTEMGAFLDWGVDKDLFVPFSEQNRRMVVGKTYVVRILLDEKTNRVMGSSKVAKFVESDATALPEGQKVSLLIADIWDEGARAIVDGKYFGMIFRNELFGDVEVGSDLVGYVKKVREDGALALTLSPQGYKAAVDEGPKILEKLRRAGGFLPYGDKTDPETIRRIFGLSKGTFKKAIGNLFKDGAIEISPFGIRYTGKDTNR